jgi:hypothetical protein
VTVDVATSDSVITFVTVIVAAALIGLTATPTAITMVKLSEQARLRRHKLVSYLFTASDLNVGALSTAKKRYGM